MKPSAWSWTLWQRTSWALQKFTFLSWIHLRRPLEHFKNSNIFVKPLDYYLNSSKIPDFSRVTLWFSIKSKTRRRRVSNWFHLHLQSWGFKAAQGPWQALQRQLEPVRTFFHVIFFRFWNISLLCFTAKMFCFEFDGNTFLATSISENHFRLSVFGFFWKLLTFS